jgi:KaiC/GvpD/RAD55 family RecA-like ATPase
MPSSKDAKKSRSTNRLSSGIEELDHILGGGFPAKRLFLIEGAFELTYLADLVIHLRYFEASGSVRKAISVIKNRLSAHETSIREFEITERGLKIGTPLRQFEGFLSGTPRFLGERRTC